MHEASSSSFKLQGLMVTYRTFSAEGSRRYRRSHRELPHEMQTLDDRIQREEDVVSTFRLLRLVSVGSKSGHERKDRGP